MIYVHVYSILYMTMNWHALQRNSYKEHENNDYCEERNEVFSSVLSIAWGFLVCEKDQLKKVAALTLWLCSSLKSNQTLRLNALLSTENTKLK